MKKGGPTSFGVSDEIVAAVNNLNLPDKTFLDGEWLERRTKEDNINECLFLFDCLWLDDIWKGELECFSRRKLLEDLTLGKTSPTLRIPQLATSGFLNFYDHQKEISWTEGIVLKEISSTIPINLQGCVENGRWQKCKWRTGDTGRTVRSNS